MERLHKFIARCGVASRRKSEQLIVEGVVRVNGVIVTALGTMIDPEQDVVTVRGHRIRPEKTHHYIALHKPAGYVTTVKDPAGRPTVMALVPDVGARLFPVGRLDAATTGLLLFTNDGALAHMLAHPRYKVPKTYRAIVSGIVSSGALRRLREGVRLEDGLTAPARVAVRSRADGRSVVQLTLIEGRNRQVRRMLQAVGHPVFQLQRIAFGPIALGSLAPGQTRPLTRSELAALRRAVHGREK